MSNREFDARFAEIGPHSWERNGHHHSLGGSQLDKLSSMDGAMSQGPAPSAPSPEGFQRRGLTAPTPPSMPGAQPRGIQVTDSWGVSGDVSSNSGDEWGHDAPSAPPVEAPYEESYDDSDDWDSDEYGDFIEGGEPDWGEQDEYWSEGHEKAANEEDYDPPGEFNLERVDELPKPEPRRNTLKPGSLPSDRPIKKSIDTTKGVKQTTQRAGYRQLDEQRKRDEQQRPISTDLTFDDENAFYDGLDANVEARKEAGLGEEDEMLHVLAQPAPTILEVIRACTDAFGDDWKGWDVAVLAHEIEQRIGTLDIQAFAVVMMTRMVLGTDNFYVSPFYLEKAAVAFSGKMVDMGSIQDPTIDEIAGACEAISRIRGTDPQAWGDDVRLYIAAVAVRDGLILLPPQISFASAEHSKLMRSRIGDEFITLQRALAKSLRANQPLGMERDTFKRQVNLLQRCHMMGGAMLAPGSNAE